MSRPVSLTGSEIGWSTSVASPRIQAFLEVTPMQVRNLAPLIAASCFAIAGPVLGQTYLGNLSANRFDPNSISNPYGAGSPYKPNGVNNPYSTYGSPFSPKSATNPYATQPPLLFDQSGRFRGTLSANPYDPNSISNPYGRYGSPYSADSIQNPFGAGNPWSFDSPRNAFGKGWRVIGR
jgi:hypothetical protein